MRKNFIFTILLTAALILTALANISYSKAQLTANAATATTAQNVRQQPAPQSTVQNNAEENGNGQWLWILPLLALPFFFLLFKKHGEDEDLDSALWPYSQYSVGAKGGTSTGSADDK